MTEPVVLSGLEGTNPLGYLAALGVMEVLARAKVDARLGWVGSLVPTAAVTGVSHVDELIRHLDADRERWQGSVALAGPADHPLDDAKPPRGVDTAWATEVVATLGDGRAHADLFAGLVAEGAVDLNGSSGKPTHLHFTAGQQRFLVMARELCDQVDAERLREAVMGPWRSDSVLPSLSWDVAGGRPYAMRATDPAGAKRTSVPGADWLGLLGLATLPVRAVSSPFQERISLETTACDPGWKVSAFRWPLWSDPLPHAVIRSVVADPTLVGTRVQRERARGRRVSEADHLLGRGIDRILEAPIRRTDQGGYGSFGGAVTLAMAQDEPT